MTQEGTRAETMTYCTLLYIQQGKGLLLEDFFPFFLFFLLFCGSKRKLTFVCFSPHSFRVLFACFLFICAQCVGSGPVRSGRVGLGRVGRDTDIGTNNYRGIMTEERTGKVGIDAPPERQCELGR